MGCHIHGVEEAPEEDDDAASLAYSENPGMDSMTSTAYGADPRERGSSYSSRARGFSSSSTGSLGRRTGRGSQLLINIGDKPKAKDDDTHPLTESAVKLLNQNRADERFHRTKYALERMGGAVIGSALTTVGCAAFLLPCQLLIFQQIGAVVMAVTLYAILYTVLPLPALLMWIGPCQQDLQSFLDQLKRIVAKLKGQKPPESKEEDDRPLAPRRHILHMPTREMGSKGPGRPATRTRVTASG